MREQQVLDEIAAAVRACGAHPDRQAPGPRARRSGCPLGSPSKTSGTSAGPRLDDRVAELAREPVAEVAGAELRDRQAAGGDDDAAGARPARRSVSSAKADAVARDGLDARRAGGAARAPASHSASSMSMICRARAVAEQLALVLLVPGDAVALDQGDEVERRVAGERRAAEVGVGRDEVRRVRSSRLVKLQRPPPEMRIFSATFAAWSTSRTRRPRWPAIAGAEEAGGAGADDDRVEPPSRAVRASASFQTKGKASCAQEAVRARSRRPRRSGRATAGRPCARCRTGSRGRRSARRSCDRCLRRPASGASGGSSA